LLPRYNEFAGIINSVCKPKKEDKLQQKREWKSRVLKTRITWEQKDVDYTGFDPVTSSMLRIRATKYTSSPTGDGKSENACRNSIEMKAKVVHQRVLTGTWWPLVKHFSFLRRLFIRNL